MNQLNLPHRQQPAKIVYFFVDSNNIDVKNQLSSLSSIKTSGDWQTYSLEFFTDVHKAVNLVLCGNNAEIDDISLTEKSIISGSVVEKIDFENAYYRHDIGARALAAGKE